MGSPLGLGGSPIVYLKVLNSIVGKNGLFVTNRSRSYRRHHD